MRHVPGWGPSWRRHSAGSGAAGRPPAAAMKRPMRTLDHIGFTVADYSRSKEFYEKALAPLGMSLLLEFSDAAAGFGREDGTRPSFFIEAHGEPVHGRLHIALGADSRA